MPFGLDLFGKTLAPTAAIGVLIDDKPVTRLLVDKLTCEQADLIILAPCSAP